MRISIFIALVAFLNSCSQRQTLIIDNPTRKEITVGFDQKLSRTVSPKSHERIVIASPNTTVYLDDKKIEDITFEGSGEYLLNPTLANYYIEEVSYFEGKHTVAKGNREDIVESQLIFDDIPFDGYVRKDSSLLIRKVWEYGVDDDLPSESMAGQSATVKRKIYREIDFERYAKKQYYDKLRNH